MQPRRVASPLSNVLYPGYMRLGRRPRNQVDSAALPYDFPAPGGIFIAYGRVGAKRVALEVCA
jgi:hypothetical protein